MEDALCPNGSEAILLSLCDSKTAENGSLQWHVLLIAFPIDETGEIRHRTCLCLIIGPCNLILISRLRELPYNRRVIGFKDCVLEGEKVGVWLVPPVGNHYCVLFGEILVISSIIVYFPDDESTVQTISPRGTHMTVIPEGPRWISLEDVPEAVLWLYGTLGDVGNTVHPGSVVLELAVPVNGDRLCRVFVADVDNDSLFVCHDEGGARRDAVDGKEGSEGASIHCLWWGALWTWAGVGYWLQLCSDKPYINNQSIST